MQQKDKIKLGISCVLIIVLLFTINNASKAIRKAKKARKKTLRSTILSEEKVDTAGRSQYKISVQSPSYKLLEEETKDLALERDPFSATRIAKTKESSTELSITGILWDKETPKAIINGVIVEIGERVGVNTIVDIKQDRVILYDGSDYFELKLE